MIDNRINATLTQEDLDAVLKAINTIKQKLPFLTDLTPDERRGLTKPGNRSRAFMSGAQLLSNAFTVGLSNAGEFNTYGERTIDVVIDVSGNFAP